MLLVLRLQPAYCHSFRVADLSGLFGLMSNLPHLESLCIGVGGALVGNPERPSSLNLSSLQHLNSVHIDSFWPGSIELPPDCAVHASFCSTPGQLHEGIWAGHPCVVQNLQLPLRSACFFKGKSFAFTTTAGILWPL